MFEDLVNCVRECGVNTTLVISSTALIFLLTNGLHNEIKRFAIAS